MTRTACLGETKPKLMREEKGVNSACEAVVRVVREVAETDGGCNGKEVVSETYRGD